MDAGVLLRFLWLVLQERFLVVVLCLIGVALGANVAFLVLWYRRPALIGRLRARLQRDAPARDRRLGPVVRLVCLAVGAAGAMVAAAGGWIMWKAPDLGLFAAVWVLPAAYVAVTALYIAVSGKHSPGDGAILWWFLWPW